jgi:hypothetical protein
MKHRLVFHSLLLPAVFLALASTAFASTKWYVDGVNGSDNNNCKSRQHACKTIGHAISLASSGDSIMVAAATYTENLFIGFTLKILGSGDTTTIIDGGQADRVVNIPNAGDRIILSRVTVRNGRFRVGGGISNNGTLTINNSTLSGNIAYSSGHLPGLGGGVYNVGTLAINNSTVSGNIAAGNYAGLGGGIYNGGTLTINDSTLSGNAATGAAASGGGIYNDAARVTINNSTISSNTASGHSASGYGGGIYNYNAAVTINNSTLSGNSARHGGGDGVGGSLANYSTATLQNTIVANSPHGGNCSGTMTSNGHNLSSDATCNFNSTGDLNNTDPKLGQLGNYGGPTQTIPLLSGSPAIDAGNPNGCTDGNGHLLKTDQRGKPRPDKEDTGGCDMGAYERQKD